MQELQPLWNQLDDKKGHAGHVATRPGETGDESPRDGIAAAGEDDRDRRGRRLGGADHDVAAARDDHLRLAADQISRQFRQPIIMALRPAEFDRQVAPLDIAGFVQCRAKRGDKRGVRVGRARAQETD